ncbi:MAG: hypothetical protein GY855_01120 [candidate division Zixibacteria bacterium]|nr:hypothetical protein [candidate division Zixibacteria bacterium]
MYRKLIILSAVVLLIATTARGSPSHIFNKSPVGGDLLSADTCDNNSRWSQTPTDPEGDWALILSDSDYGFSLYDNYQVSTELVIISLAFWGTELRLEPEWSNCVESDDPMAFIISFVPDANGRPDINNPAFTYNILELGETICQLDDEYDLKRWDIELDPFCTLVSGWVGIQGVGHGDSCVFMWMNTQDLDGTPSYQFPDGPTEHEQAFCLTGVSAEECIICTVDNYSLRVPRVNGIIYWDMTVTNCGSMNFPEVIGEIIPTNYD